MRHSSIFLMFSVIKILRRHSRAANRATDGANRALLRHWTKVPDQKVTILIVDSKGDSGYSQF